MEVQNLMDEEKQLMEFTRNRESGLIVRATGQSRMKDRVVSGVFIDSEGVLNEISFEITMIPEGQSNLREFLQVEK